MIMKRVLNRWFNTTATQINYNFADVLTFENVQMNRKWLDERLASYGLRTLVSDSDTENDGGGGCMAERVEIEIDWMEIFKYWTEIKQQQLGVSDPESDEFDPEYSKSTDSGSSCLRITGLQINVDATTGSTDENPLVDKEFKREVSEELELFNDDTDTPDEDFKYYSSGIGFDTISHFIKHVLAQFRLEIVDFRIKCPDALSIDMIGTLTIGTEDVYGFRTANIPEIWIKSGCLEVVVERGMQVKLNSDLRENKITIPAININILSSANETEFRDRGLVKILDVLAVNLARNRNSNTNAHKNGNTYEVNLKIDLIAVNLEEISGFIYDFVLEKRKNEDSINFITGHFLLKRKERVLLKSDLQMPIITGNISGDKVDIKVTEGLLVEFESIQDIEEFRTILMSHVETIGIGYHTDNDNDIDIQMINDNNLKFKYKYKISLCLSQINLRLNDVEGERYLLNFSDVLIENSSDFDVEGFDFISISSKEIKIQNRTNSIRFQNIQFITTKTSTGTGNCCNEADTSAEYFSDVKRFIENDEFVTIIEEEEEEDKIYGKNNLNLNEIKIENIFIEINELYNNNNNNNKKKTDDSVAKDFTLLNIMGSVTKHVNVKIKLRCESGVVEYEFDVNQLKFIKNGDFLDLRGNFKGVCRNSINIIDSDDCGKIVMTVKDMKMVVFDMMNFSINVPYDILTVFESDFALYNTILMKSRVSNTNTKNMIDDLNLYLRLRNVKLKLIPPPQESSRNHNHNNIIREEYILVTELNAKYSAAISNQNIICYLDQMKLFTSSSTSSSDSDEAVVTCGLVKIEIEPVKSKSTFKVKINNYWTVFDFYGKERFECFLKIVQFWTEIYSPRISESDPRVILHESHIFDEDDEAETEDNEENLMLLKGEWNESMDLLLETDEITSSSCRSDYDLDEEYDLDCDGQFTLDNNTDILSEIDEDFFTFTRPNTKEPSAINTTTYITTNTTDVLLELNFGLQVNFYISPLAASSAVKSRNCVTVKMKEISVKLYEECDEVEIEVKEGEIVDSLEKSDWNTLMTRWRGCGPDPKNRRFGEENFLKICMKKKTLDTEMDVGDYYCDNNEEFDLSISMCPLRLFLNQLTVSELINFFNVNNLDLDGADSKDDNKELRKKFLYFNKVNISPLAVKLDYKDKGITTTKEQTARTGTIPINLNGAEFILPRVQLSGIKGFEGLLPAISSIWIPQLKERKNLTNILSTGVVPVRTVLQMSEGLTNLILLPLPSKGKNYSSSSASAARRAGRLRESCKKISLNSLNAATSILNRTQTSIFNQKRKEREYPVDLESGLKQAAKLIIALPVRNGRELRAVPILILDSIATTGGVILKTLQGLQAEWDENYRTDTEHKHKQKTKK